MGSSIGVPVHSVDSGGEGVWGRRSLSARESCIKLSALMRNYLPLLERESVETAGELGLNICGLGNGPDAEDSDLSS